jgi:hypothetical protein
MASDLNLAALDQLTREYIEKPEVYDQVFESASTLKAMKNAGMVETGVDMGIQYQWMVRHALPPGPVPYTAYETFPLAASDPFDRVHLEPKNYAQTLVIPKTKLDANIGNEVKLADLVAEVVEAGIEQFSAGLNVDIFNDGTDPKRIVGLRSAMGMAWRAGVAIAADVDRTYAGVNSAVDHWWRPSFLGDSGNFTLANLINEASDYFVYNVLDRCIYILKQKNQNPSNFILVTTMGFANLISNEARNPFLNIGMGDLKRVDLSPINLYHHGIPIMPDVDCPGSAAAASDNWTFAYFLNKKSTKLMFGNVYGANETKVGIFEWEGWKDMQPVQEVIAGNLKCRCILAVKQPGANLVLGVDDTVLALVT